jgi:DNA repair exonuclease SbcCD ATPase subunit
MADRVSSEEREQITALLKAATSGEWEWDDVDPRRVNASDTGNMVLRACSNEGRGNPTDALLAVVLRNAAPALLSALEEAESQLAECYRLTGADPDGDEDWRLAPFAVQEVKRFREESDEDEARILALSSQVSSLTRERDHYRSGMALSIAEDQLRDCREWLTKAEAERDTLKGALTEAQQAIERLSKGGALPKNLVCAHGRAVFVGCEACKRALSRGEGRTDHE